jgi:subtilase family serine protease
LQFDGYNPSDILAYEATNGLPNVPLTNVLVDGCTGIPDDNAQWIYEVSMDIELAIAMAPGLTSVLVYEAPPSSDSNFTSFLDILNRMATDNLAKQISASWVWTGPLASTAAGDEILQQLAAQGQSFFVGSGDWGAYEGGVNSSFRFWPSESPYATSVGGTVLSTSGPGGSWTNEQAWDQQSSIGSGGGVSQNYAIPTWQQGISMATNQGSLSLRNLPDVSACTGGGYVFYNNEVHTSSGTSASLIPRPARCCDPARRRRERRFCSGHKPVRFATLSGCVWQKRRAI